LGSRDNTLRWVPGVTIVVLAWLTLFPIVSVDAHYHLATGRRILEEGAIPDRGVGSATFGQAPWHDNEWGFQLLAALLAPPREDAGGVWVISRGGVVALILMRAVCLALTLALMSAQMARSGVGPLTRAVALTLAAFLTFGNLFWTVRPQIFSYLGLAAVAWLLERHRSGEGWPVWLVLPVIAVWANLHGAFVIGVALVGAEAVGETIQRRWGGRPSGPDVRRLWLVTLLGPLAACLNPHGYLQVLHPFLYLLEPEIHRGNAEWTRPDFLHLPLFVLTLLLLAAALWARGRPRVADLTRGIAFTVLLFTAIRHLPLAAIVLVPVLAASAAAAARRGGARRHLEPTGPGWGSLGMRAAAAVLLVAAIVGLSGAFTRSGARFVTLLPRFEFRSVSPMPERHIRWIAQSGLEGSIFNSYRFGGFLMYRLYPEERAFMDGRNDLYREFRDDVYNRILGTRSGWRGALRQAVREHDVCCALLDAADPLGPALEREPGWRRVRDAGDDAAGLMLLVRDAGSAP
jgi:hypothetical protein